MNARVAQGSRPQNDVNRRRIPTTLDLLDLVWGLAAELVIPATNQVDSDRTINLLMNMFSIFTQFYTTLYVVFFLCIYVF